MCHILCQIINKDELVAGEWEGAVVNSEIVDGLDGLSDGSHGHVAIAEHIPWPLAYKYSVTPLLSLANRSHQL